MLQYGFFKARRGPDANMYFHPSFIRGAPYLLSELLKCKKAQAQSPSRIQNREHDFITNDASRRLLDGENFEKALKVQSKAVLSYAQCRYNAAMYTCIPQHQQKLMSTNTQSLLPYLGDELSSSESDSSWRRGNSNEAFHKIFENSIVSENEASDSLHYCPDSDGVSTAVSSKASLNDCAAMALISLAGCAS